MNTLQLSRGPVAKAEMLIRRPVAEVFEAFVNPAITTQFWFTKSSGRLEAGKRVQWDWEMYDVSMPIVVKSLDAHRRLVIEWPGEDSPTTVAWTFTRHADDATFVSISHTGFTGDGDQIVQQAIESTEGFTLVLAGLKALLEHRVRLDLVGDRFPRGFQGR
jgi:uncharacterized protein YndB with AHSA1/START domain